MQTQCIFFYFEKTSMPVLKVERDELEIKQGQSPSFFHFDIGRA